MKKILFIAGLMMFSMVLTITPALSTEFDLGGGKSVNVLGSLSNQLQFSTLGEHYDTEQDLQQFLTSLQLMADFRLSPTLSAYISGIATVDWIYDLKHNNVKTYNGIIHGKTNGSMNPGIISILTMSGGSFSVKRM